jgi:hypothetical protein
VSSIHRCTEKLKHGGARGERGESVRPVLVAGGPSEEPLTAAKSRLNRATIARSPSSVSFTVSMQNEFSYRVDQVGRNLIANCAPQLELGPSQASDHGALVALFGRAEEEGMSRAVRSWMDDQD